MISAMRYHDISCGHRVVGHEGKCRHLHGHNYRVHFEVMAMELDKVGRVLDFGVIKSKLCEWLESHWDHKMLIWTDDPQAHELKDLDKDGVWFVPFNPTAENMAQFLVEVIGPDVFVGMGVTLVEVIIEETRKCSVKYRLEGV